MAFTLRALTPHGTGAEISGVDLSQPHDPAIRKALNEAFARHHVLVIRGQKLSARTFAHAAENFGEIMPQQIKGHEAAEHPDVFVLRPIEMTPGDYRAPGGDGFHTDHCWDTRPPKATSLYPVLLPSGGGDTQFCNTALAWDELPEAMKRRIGDLTAVHTYLSRNARYKVRTADDKNTAIRMPPSVHPLVPLHADNGRRYLYISQSRLETIQGMNDEETVALVRELMDHATQQKYEYRHVWRAGDMVIWDNRCLLHKANGDYDMKEGEGRMMYRLMVKGGVPLAAPPA